MNFKDAYELLKEGKAISRMAWENDYHSRHLQLKADVLLCFVRMYDHLEFNDDFLTKKWSVVGDPSNTKLDFADAIGLLNDGMRIYEVGGDKSRYIGKDNAGDVYLSYLHCNMDSIGMRDFLATDWGIYECL